MSSNYKSIAKANALFGGVQIYNIIIGILRSKFVAILLGPEGMGIMGLYQSTIDLVKSATNFGLQTSAVRDVALANSTGNNYKIREIHTVLSKLVWFTGFLGAIVTLVFAKQLSIYTFENEEYTNGFRLLAVTLLIAQLTVSNQVILQGLRRLKDLARSNVIGSTLGLIVVIPLYYFWGYEAIVPVMIFTVFTSYVVSEYYVRQIHLGKLTLSSKDIFKKGRPMLVMGFMLSLTGFMDMIEGYVIKIYISRLGGVSEVGLYNAGFAFILGYVGLVFNAIGSDYFSRLTMASKDKESYNSVINQQLEIMLLVLTPLLVAFITFSRELILLFYTDEFLPISMMINLMCIGMVFRAINWCQGYLILAKGDTKFYSFTYILVFIISFVAYIWCYKEWGLTGIGIAFVFIYLYCASTCIFVVKYFYDCIYNKVAYRIMLYAFAFTLSVFAIHTFVEERLVSLPLCIILVIGSIYLSYRGLNNRLDVKGLIINKLQKNERS